LIDERNCESATIQPGQTRLFGQMHLEAALIIDGELTAAPGFEPTTSLLAGLR
jgi:hypothetical protein